MKIKIFLLAILIILLLVLILNHSHFILPWTLIGIVFLIVFSITDKIKEKNKWSENNKQLFESRNKFAIASLVLTIAVVAIALSNFIIPNTPYYLRFSWFFIGPIFLLLAIILGILGLKSTQGIYAVLGITISVMSILIMGFFLYWLYFSPRI